MPIRPPWARQPAMEMGQHLRMLRDLVGEEGALLASAGVCQPSRGEAGGGRRRRYSGPRRGPPPRVSGASMPPRHVVRGTEPQAASMPTSIAVGTHRSRNRSAATSSPPAGPGADHHAWRVTGTRALLVGVSRQTTMRITALGRSRVGPSGHATDPHTTVSHKPRELHRGVEERAGG